MPTSFTAATTRTATAGRRSDRTELLPIAHVITSPETQLSYQIERLLGRTQAELTGVEVTEIFTIPGPAERERGVWQRTIKRRIEAGRAFREENVCFATFYGRTIPVSLQVNPILKNGAVVGAVVVFADPAARRTEPATATR